MGCILLFFVELYWTVLYEFEHEMLSFGPYEGPIYRWIDCERIKPLLTRLLPKTLEFRDFLCSLARGENSSSIGGW
jgi:hypothetical protein